MAISIFSGTPEIIFEGYTSGSSLRLSKELTGVTPVIALGNYVVLPVVINIVAEIFCCSEINNLYLIIYGNKDVFRIDIPVDYSAVVQNAQSL